MYVYMYISLAILIYIYLYLFIYLFIYNIYKWVGELSSYSRLYHFTYPTSYVFVTGMIQPDPRGSVIFHWNVWRENLDGNSWILTRKSWAQLSELAFG